MLANKKVTTSENSLKWLEQHLNSSKDQLICSFGHIGPTKHSLEIIKAFVHSKLASNGWILFLA